MRRWIREHGLLLANAGLFLLFFLGMVITGFDVYNSDLTDHGRPGVSLGAYLASGDFAERWGREPGWPETRR
jgi:hypothetical protein